MVRYSDSASPDEAVLIETDDFALVYDRRNRAFHKKRWDSSTKSWTTKKAPYSAIVCKDGSTVWAEDASGKTIASGEAGVDDASVIQSAINSLESGNVMRLRAGVYKLSEGLQIQKGVHIVGEGYKSDKDHNLGAVIEYEGAGVALDFGGSDQFYYGGGAQNITLRNPSTTKQGTGIRFQRVALLRLEHVRVQNFKTGVEIAGCWEPYVSDIQVAECGDSASSSPAMKVAAMGDTSADQTNNAHFINLHFGGCEYIALSIETNCYRLTFKGITAEIQYYSCIGIKNLAHDVDFTNLEIYGGNPCLQLGDSGVHTHRVKISSGTLYGKEDANVVRVINLFDSSLSNLVIMPVGGHGIDGDNLYRVAFNGIIIRSTKDATDKAGFYLENGRQINVVGSHIKDVFSRAIYTYNINGLAITGCTFEECAKQTGHYTVHLESCYNAIVEGNTFYSSLADYPVRAVYATNPTNVKVTNNILYGYLGSNPISFAGTITDSKIAGNIGYATENSGTATFSGDGTTTQFSIAHGLVSTPTKVLVTPMTADAASDFYVTADDTNIYINYKSAPPSGTDNLKFSWYAEV